MELDDQIALYALGALEPAEAAELARQAAASPDLRRRIAEDRAVVRALAETPDPVAPSPAVLTRLMTQIAAQETPLQQRLETAARERQRVRGESTAPSFSLLRGLLIGLGAVGAAALAIVSLNLVQTQNQLAAAREEAASARAKLKQVSDALADQESVGTALNARIDALTQSQRTLDAQIAEARKALETAQNELTTARGDARKSAQALRDVQANLDQVQRELAILGAPNARRATLAASKTQYSNGVVAVVFAPDQNSGVVTVANLPPLPADLCYQLWLIDGANPLPSVVITTDANGNGRVLVPSDLAFGNYEQFGVTVERAGGSPTPNPEGPIYLGKAG